VFERLGGEQEQGHTEDQLNANDFRLVYGDSAVIHIRSDGFLDSDQLMSSTT
jgi:hypothetical protein